MSHRSDVPRNRSKASQNTQIHHQHGKEFTYLPPISAADRMPAPRTTATSGSMTGQLGMRSAPRQPTKAFSSSQRLIDSGRSKPHQKASPKKDSGSHTYNHDQKHRSSTPKPSPREHRSGSSSPNPSLGHRRSSSWSSVPRESKQHPSLSRTSMYNGTPADSRPTKGGDVWNGSGSDPIAHRTHYDAKKYSPTAADSTRDVREPGLHNSLAQSDLKDSTSRHYAALANGTGSPASTGGGSRAQFDASVGTQYRTYNTTPSLPLDRNANNNSGTIGSKATALPLSTPRTFSNGGYPQSDPFSPTLPRVLPDSSVGEGLSGGGTCYSKLADQPSRTTVHKYSPKSDVSSYPGARHTPSSPPYTASKSPSSSPPTSGAVSWKGGLRGLRNLGNTCFMNSILQCLSHTPGLAEVFLDKKTLKSCSKKSMLKGELAKAYAELVSEMWSEVGSVAVSPQAFKSQIQKYARRFMGYEQQDCQEFLRFMLAGLHDDLNQPKERPRSAKSFSSDQARADYCWKKYLSYECSKISDLFMGQLKSTLVCLKCKERSLTFDPFWDLSLPMHRTKGYGSIPLESCLIEFTAKERLTGSEQAYCEKCDALCDSEKCFELQVLPEILVLHLKRFSGLRFRSKLDTAVEVPMELDLGPYIVKPSEVAKGTAESSKYCLYAMSNHSGTAYGGHYTAISRHVVTRKWHSFNDSQVSAASPPNHATSQAYVLFYHKKK